MTSADRETAIFAVESLCKLIFSDVPKWGKKASENEFLSAVAGLKVVLDVMNGYIEVPPQTPRDKQLFKAMCERTQGKETPS